jgi:hypothetical protein
VWNGFRAEDRSKGRAVYMEYIIVVEVVGVEEPGKGKQAEAEGS